ncbi:MAG TPA: helix-turn-helix transcriptional regulator [Candidatus Acidoferrum sp.]|nr:helix-turn-helix transcriptional regulator [Candidatus Acidoferrum sp.]
MTSPRLQNYLRSGRKRLALSQDEVAFLMGRRGGAKISNYESFSTTPTLETALAFGIIYGTPLNELFAGIHDRLARDISERAKVLRHRVSFKATSRRSEKKRAAVESLLANAATANQQPA